MAPDDIPLRDHRHGDDPVDPDLGPTEGGPSARTLLAVALGGALGAPARYAIAQVIHSTTSSFPWATFWTNISGSFVLGLFLIVVVERFPPSRYLRAFVATGFLGAFTTFSTLVVDVDLLTKASHFIVAVVYLASSLVVGLGAVWLGISIGRRLAGARP